MKAYVQQVRESNSIYLAMMQADHWFGQRGYEVVRFEFADVADGVLDDDLLKHPDEMVVRGGVGTIRQLLQRAGRPLPPNIDLPQSLSKWIGRQFWQSTLGKSELPSTRRIFGQYTGRFPEHLCIQQSDGAISSPDK
jgi:hypothetical protein